MVVGLLGRPSPSSIAGIAPCSSFWGGGKQKAGKEKQDGGRRFIADGDGDWDRREASAGLCGLGLGLHHLRAIECCAGSLLRPRSSRSEQPVL
jgi:hypothetical protein